MTHKDRSKLPLLVLAAGGILLGAAALQSVLITAPGPSGDHPHAISVDTARQAGIPAPSPVREPAAAVQADPTTTGTVPDPPASHAIDLASPPSPASAPDSTKVTARPPTHEMPTGEPDMAAVAAPKIEAPAAAAKLSPEPEPSQIAHAPETTAEPAAPVPPAKSAEAAAAPKVEAPAAAAKLVPEPEPTQIAHAPETTAEPAAPAPPAKIEESAADPKVETPAAAAKLAPEPEPSQIAAAPDTAQEEAPEPAISPPSPKIEEPAAADARVESPSVQSEPSKKPEPEEIAKTEATEETPEPVQAPITPKSEVKEASTDAAPAKPEPTPAKSEAKPRSKAVPAVKPKDASTAKTQAELNAKSMSLGFGRAAAARSAGGKVSSSLYAANVRAAIGRHRPGVRGGGSATVAFSIGPAGGLQGVKVVRSSGKAQLDQAAIATVRSAAPFPPPPGGVNSTFSIRIYFR